MPDYVHGCRHCGEANIDRRGLCRRCYRSPSIRKMYRKLESFGRRGSGLDNKTRAASKPTNALPGTLEKIAVLESRAHRNESLWHPLDAVYALDG